MEHIFAIEDVNPNVVIVWQTIGNWKVGFSNGKTYDFTIHWDVDLQMTIYALTEENGLGFQSCDFVDILTFDGDVS